MSPLQKNKHFKGSWTLCFCVLDKSFRLFWISYIWIWIIQDCIWKAAYLLQLIPVLCHPPQTQCRPFLIQLSLESVSWLDTYFRRYTQSEVTGVQSPSGKINSLDLEESCSHLTGINFEFIMQSPVVILFWSQYFKAIVYGNKPRLVILIQIMIHS